MPRSPLVGRALACRRTLAAVIPAALLLVLASCSGATEPGQLTDPPKVATIVLSPDLSAMLKGSTSTLTAVVLDSAGGEIRDRLDWSTSAPAVASVSETGVVTGVGYGAVTITATIGRHHADARIVVTGAPAARTYAVEDLGVVHGIDEFTLHFSDSGTVLARQTGMLYRNGVGATIPGCPYTLALNRRGHVLCLLHDEDTISDYALWRDGAMAPLAVTDTFTAQHFRAFALNDSDEVAGLFFMPSFVNPNCPASGARCLSIWKDGTPIFPGATGASSSADAMFMNNKRQVVLDEPMFDPYRSRSALIYDTSTGSHRSAPSGVRAFNDNAWGVIDSQSLTHGPTAVVSVAKVTTPDTLIVFGFGAATGINDSNVVVGTLTVGPFIWRGNGVSLLTNATVDAGWTVTAADQINDRGQILATADNADGRKGHTVVLTPIAP